MFRSSDPRSFRATRVFARDVYNRASTCLPIYAERREIEQSLSKPYAALVLSAETGSGKSTQVIQYLSEMSLHGIILCTQPRRIATINLARRVAEEMQTTTPTGHDTNGPGAGNLVTAVGHCSTRGASVVFMTDYAMMERLYRDPLLRGVAAVVVDEVHERSSSTDLAVALLRRTLHRRCAEGGRPFKVVLTSATMDEELFARYYAPSNWEPEAMANAQVAKLSNQALLQQKPSKRGSSKSAAASHILSAAPILRVGGRTFPVEIRFSDVDHDDYVSGAEKKALELDSSLPPTSMARSANHDLLIFMPQVEDCNALVRRLQSALSLRDCAVLPLHGALDDEERQQAFKRTDDMRQGGKPVRRKIIVSTNMAETSVTIDGVGAVIDTGKSKQATYDAKNDATVLQVALVAQANAKQRAGRAGRTAPGVCHRLYTQSTFNGMEHEQVAELLRVDPTTALVIVLRMIQKHRDWIADVTYFPFVQAPKAETLRKAVEVLQQLEILEANSAVQLTPRGDSIAKLVQRAQISPRTATILLRAQSAVPPSMPAATAASSSASTSLSSSSPVLLLLACVVTGMASVGSRLLKRPAAEEMKAIEEKRVVLYNNLARLGDAGLWITLFVHAQRLLSKGNGGATKLREWCKEHCISHRSLREGMKQANVQLSVVQEKGSHPVRRAQSSAEASTSSAAPASLELVSAQPPAADDAHVDDAPSTYAVNVQYSQLYAARWSSLSHAVAADLAMQRSLLSLLLYGYFGNVTFLLPAHERDTQEGRPPLLYVPHASITAFMQAHALMLKTHFMHPNTAAPSLPTVLLYLEGLHQHDRVYLNGLIPIHFQVGSPATTVVQSAEVKHLLASSLPPRYTSSPHYLRSMELAHRQQLMARPTFIRTGCPMALRTIAGKKRAGLDDLQQEMRRQLKLPEEHELRLEVDHQRQELLVRCTDANARDAVAQHMQQRLTRLEANLAAAVVEFNLPKTAVRAVIGAGGACKEIISDPMASIHLKFTCEPVADRFSEPIQSYKHIPPGFFTTLLHENVQLPGATALLQTMTHSMCVADGRFSVQTVLQSNLALSASGICVEELWSAVEYTRGGAPCYTVNQCLRALNEQECRKFAPFILYLQSFRTKRAQYSGRQDLAAAPRVVYRGCMLPRDQLLSYVVGETQIWPAFTSTSSSRDVAAGFAGHSSREQVSVMFEITMKPDYGCPLQDISAYPQEREILLPAFTAIRVRSVRVRGQDRADIQLEVMDHVPVSSEPPRPVASVIPDSGIGPVFIPVSGDQTNIYGVRTTLLEQLQRLDEHANIEAKLCDEDTAIHGRCTFTSLAGSLAACQLLHGSMIGDLVVQMRFDPIATEKVHIQHIVQVSLTSVPHKGVGFVKAGSSKLVAKMLGMDKLVFRQKLEWSRLILEGAMEESELPKGALRIPQRQLGRLSIGAAFDLVKANKPANGAWHQVGKGRRVLSRHEVRVSGIPASMTARQVEALLREEFGSQLPFGCVSHLERDRTELRDEQKQLRVLAGHRARKEALAAIAPGVMVHQQDGRSKFGAGYKLSFKDSKSANAWVQKHDGTRLSIVLQEATDSRAAAPAWLPSDPAGYYLDAQLKLHAEMSFRQTVWEVVKEQVEQIKDEVQQDFGDSITLYLHQWKERVKPNVQEQKPAGSSAPSFTSAAVASAPSPVPPTPPPPVPAIPPPWSRTRLFLTCGVSEAFFLREIYNRFSPLQRGLVWHLTPDQRKKVFAFHTLQSMQTALVASLTTAAEEQQCRLERWWRDGAIVVYGEPKAALRVKEEVQQLLAVQPFHCTIRIANQKAAAETEAAVMQELSAEECKQVSFEHDAAWKEALSQRMLLVRATTDAAFCLVKQSVHEHRSQHRIAAGNLPAELVEQQSEQLLCCICMTSSTDERLATCGHRMCDECGRQHLVTSMLENRYPLSCPVPECKRPLLAEDMVRLSEQYVELYNKAVQNYARDQGYKTCHTQGCEMFLQPPAADDSSGNASSSVGSSSSSRKGTSGVTCPMCQVTQCLDCGADPHPGQTCVEYAAELAFESSDSGKVVSLLSRGVVDCFLAPFCRECNAAFMDFNGCFALTCNTCHAGLCGYCLTSVGKRVDSHPHVLKCTFAADHNIPGAGYFPPDPEPTFARCMRARLAELAAGFITATVRRQPAHRQLIPAILERIRPHCDGAPHFEFRKLKAEVDRALLALSQQ